MIEITSDTKWIVLPGKEARRLRKEMESAFVLMDMDTGCGMYSMEKIKKYFPLMAEMFKII